MAKPLLQVALDHSDLKGAIKAAVWVVKQQNGLYDIDDCLGFN